MWRSHARGLCCITSGRHTLHTATGRLNVRPSEKHLPGLFRRPLYVCCLRRGSGRRQKSSGNLLPFEHS
ncbi:GTP cyclohydrolase II [Neisseria bacilliformis ATCC BAA-1200]|uniref:GTP cyclohydrolase II n=1 Tax=Neisseria bacilliformis ATCC BAA-1200 TaxID=888742 RepID=F2BAB1_9NEIS|nr:GTP cyclohydrolase II [Neisseria bacilliformis ATCC BAA-1200]